MYQIYILISIGENTFPNIWKLKFISCPSYVSAHFPKGLFVGSNKLPKNTCNPKISLTVSVGNFSSALYGCGKSLCGKLQVITLKSLLIIPVTAKFYTAVKWLLNLPFYLQNLKVNCVVLKCRHVTDACGTQHYYNMEGADCCKCTNQNTTNCSWAMSECKDFREVILKWRIKGAHTLSCLIPIPTLVSPQPLTLNSCPFQW